MIRGIIYMYTSPIGKSYIGQTTNEKLRRKLWRSSSYHYAGTKIDRARQKYGFDTFNYITLFEKVFSTKEIAAIWLNIVEQYYIQKYNTVKKGYNCEYGGGGHSNHIGAINHHHGGYKLSEETKRRIGAASSKWQNSPEGKAIMSAAKKNIKRKKGYRIEKKFKPVIQLSLNGEYIQEFPSIKDAEKSLLEDKCTGNSTNIGAVCRGMRDTAKGYKWLFSDDYYMYFLHQDREDIPQRVRRTIEYIAKRNTSKIRKKYLHKSKPKKEGPKINRFAQQIGQYDLNLKLVKVWRCANEVEKALGIHQENVSRASRTLGTYMGYYWRKYNGEQNIQPKSRKKPINYWSRKKVAQMDMDDNILNVYNSIGEACRVIGANNRTLMSKCLNNKVDKAYGFKWKFINCA